jgi:hypothetical protein
MAGVALVAAACAPGTALPDGSGPASSAPSSPVATPTFPPPGPTEAPSSDVNLEPNQSAGEVTIRLAGPLAADGTAGAVCTYDWTAPLRLASVEAAPFLAVGSERVGALVEPIRLTAGAMPDEFPAGLLITRSGGYGPGERAAYGPDAGGSLNVESALGLRIGRVSFTDLPTIAATFAVDLLPVARALFGEPLAGNAAAETISGVVEWSCAPPRASWQPEPAGPPEPPPGDELPRFACGVTSADLVQRGVPLCGFESSVCGPSGGCTVGGDSCGSGWVSPLRYPPALAVAPSATLTVQGLDGWTVTEASARAVTVDALEASLGQADLAPLEPAGDAAVGFLAPSQAGSWIVVVDVRATIEAGDRTGTVRGPVLFRVDVGG